MNRSLRILVLATVGCGTVTIDEYEICTLDLTFEPAAGAPGTEIRVLGTPLTEIRDTRIEVGGARATVTEVVREGCEACDVCLVAGGCPPCGGCEGLGFDTPEERAACLGDPLADPPIAGDCASCSESMAFVVPDLPPGPTTVVVLNRNGQSGSLTFEVLPGVTDTASSP